MTHSYISGAGLGKQLRRLGLTALLAGGTALVAQAQNLNYTTAGATNVTTTYTDLGTTGTAITTASNDDANSAAQNIGFSFAYNGTTFSQFFLNTNGFIELGASPSATAMYLPEAAGSTAVNPFTSAVDPNVIAPFNMDLTAGSAGGTEYRVYTSGSAGSRICTIQWKNVADKAAVVSTQYANFSFQVRLYEATGVVEMVYSTATAGTGTAGARYAQVGLKGSTFANNQIVQVSKNSGDAWSASTFSNYATAASSGFLNTFNFRQSILPDAGRTYRFTPLAPPVTNDAAVTSVFTLGKLPVPAALPHAVQAVISNPGITALTNLAVTLNVTGANTFTNTQTITSLASGATTTVTFAAYPTTLVAGTNTVTVTVPTDGNNANNSAAVQQAVATGTGTFSYVPADQTNTAGTYVVGAPTTAGGILATKYTTQRAGTVTSVSVYLGSVAASTTVASSVGKTVYGVVLSPAGAVLGQSANYVIQTSDLGTYKTFSITTPPAVTAGGSFLAGLAQAAYTGLPYYPVIIQDEAPTRTDAYFAVPLAGGTPVDQALNANGTNSGFGRLMMEATLSVALATSKELQRAITVYPNPSESGVFNLNVQAANAANGLGVEVTNQLGQRVYTGTARDNNTTKLDLSNLANGIYHLQVRNGQEYTSSQISIVK